MIGKHINLSVARIVFYTKECSRMSLSLFLFLFGFFWSAGNLACAEDAVKVRIFPDVVKPGEVCLLKASGLATFASVRGEFRGIQFPLFSGIGGEACEGLVGVDLDTPPGGYKVKVWGGGKDGKTYSGTHTLTVKRGDFKTQKLTLPSDLVDLDARTLARVDREEKRVKDLFLGFRDERLWRGPFLQPVQGKATTAFGLRRVINRQPKNPHSGVDLEADEGTPVKATNGGVFVLVDELFFSGKSAILDHGWGIYSMYFHLSQTRIRTGDKIDKGGILGLAGSTGRSTGPHLHWGIQIRGARVDPFSLVRATKNMPE